MRNCDYCKTRVNVTYPSAVILKDFYPMPPEKPEFNPRNERTNNAINPLNHNKTLDLCNDCIDLVEENGFLEINKIGDKKPVTKKTK